jgi:hypothetical protein
VARPERVSEGRGDRFQTRCSSQSMPGRRHVMETPSAHHCHALPYVRACHTMITSASGFSLALAEVFGTTAVIGHGNVMVLHGMVNCASGPLTPDPSPAAGRGGKRGLGARDGLTGGANRATGRLLRDSVPLARGDRHQSGLILGSRPVGQRREGF